MSLWSVKRRFIYLSVAVLFFVLLVSLLYLIFIRQPASCVDKIQNQDELGVDCGGSCDPVCSLEVSPLIKDWTRLFKIGEGKYDVAALIENPNFNLGLKKLNYTFKLYDRDNLFIVEKTGSVFVNARDKFVIFETGLDTSKRTPIKAILEFGSDPIWFRVLPQTSKTPIIVQNQVLVEGQAPRLMAELINDSVFDLTDVTITALIYDDDNNAIAASQTFLNYIQKGKSEDIVFTWPGPFSSERPTFEIYPRVNLVR